MRSDRVPLRAIEVSMLAVPVPEQSRLDTLHAPAGVLPDCVSNPSQIVSDPQVAGGGVVGGGVVGGGVVGGGVVGGGVVGGGVVRGGVVAGTVVVGGVDP